MSIDARSASLWDEGARRLADAWDDGVGLVRAGDGAGLHDARGSLAYCRVLLREGTPAAIARAERIIAGVAAMQELRPQDAHYGNFRWFFEDAAVTDLNAVEFVLDELQRIVRAGNALNASTREQIVEMIRLGLEEVDRLDVHPSYTNIALSDIANSVLGGEAIGEPRFVERGRTRLDEWFDLTNASGAPHEYNSPTYLAVDILRMAALAEQTFDPSIALKARVAEERLWLHAAAHYHPGLAQLAGPHSRSYRDGWTGAGGFLKLLLWKLLGDDRLRAATPYFPRGREEGFTSIAEAALHCPDYVADWLRARPYPSCAQSMAGARRGASITTYMRASYALGVASSSWGVGEPPEHWPQPNSILLHARSSREPGYAVLYGRYVIDDHDAASGEFPDDGQFAGAQAGNRAIAAYGLRPRLRAAERYRMSMRLLGGATCDAWAGERALGSEALAVDPGEPVVADTGGVYIAMIPLAPSDMGSDAGIELRRDGAELVLDACNYRGPAKSFWEHRSQAGPFFKGNVRNAMIIEVAEHGEYADAAAFRAHVAAASIADSVDDDGDREIVYASAGGSLSLRYSLRDMSIAECKRDGVAWAPEMGSAGVLDGTGPQWVQSRDALIERGGAKLMAGRVPKWLFADAGAGRYVFVNPSDEEVPVWLETSATIVECDAFSFGRIEIDEGAAKVLIEAEGEIGAVRIGAAAAARLFVNGVDVTGALHAPDVNGMREFNGG